VFVGIAFSNVVMFSIIVATGATIGAHGNVTITTAPQAAQALRPVAGGLSETFFALGFIGSGMLAIPVLAGAGSVGMAGLLHKEWGFSRSPRQAPVFYGLVLLGTLGGTLLTFTGIDPVKLLVFSALVNGLLAAPLPRTRHAHLRRPRDHGRLHQRTRCPHPWLGDHHPYGLRRNRLPLSHLRIADQSGEEKGPSRTELPDGSSVGR
jgi:hypothetical protein